MAGAGAADAAVAAEAASGRGVSGDVTRSASDSWPQSAMMMRREGVSLVPAAGGTASGVIQAGSLLTGIQAGWYVPSFIAATASHPATTRPNATCLLSKLGAARKQIKNCNRGALRMPSKI